MVLDSPLLVYREPDGTEDDLTGTDLQEQFYSYLAALPINVRRWISILDNDHLYVVGRGTNR